MSVSIPTKLPRDYLFDAGMSRIPGARRVIASGVNPDIDTATVPEDIWYAGGLYPLPLTAASLEVLSSSANDAAAGTGMRTAVVSGLDINYAEISETVTLNGTNVIALSGSYLRINSFVIATAGSGRVNAGIVTIREAGAGQTRAQMRAGYGIARQAVYTVPAGYTLGVNSLILSVLRITGTTPDATFATYLQAPNGSFLMAQEVAISTQPFQLPIDAVASIPEKWDFMIRCTTVSDNNLEVSASFTGILVNNAYL